MIFETYQSDQPLSGLIESVLYYKDYIPEHSIERLVPTGNVFLLFELDNIPRNTFHPKTLKPDRTFTGAWISGMHQNHLSISAHPHSEMLIVQFKATGAYPFLHNPMIRLSEKILSANEIFGNEVLMLREKIITLDLPGKFQAVEQWLLGRLDKTKLAPDDLVSMVNRLKIDPFATHHEIVREYHKTQKALIEQFKKYIGLTPKTLHRILRFNTLLEIIKEKKEINWTHIAYETGFSDQAHFIKEFQNFCGFNPSEYIRNEYNKQVPNFFPIRDVQG